MALLAVGYVYCLGAAFGCGEHVAGLCECAMGVSRGHHRERREQTASQSAPASKLFWTNGLSDLRRMDARGRPGRTGRKETKPATPRRLGASRQKWPSGPMPAAPQCGSRSVRTQARRGRFKLSGSSCGARFKMVLALTCIQQTPIHTRNAPKRLLQANLGVSEESATDLKANRWVKPERGMGSAQKRGRPIARRNAQSGAARTLRKRTPIPVRRTLRRHAAHVPAARRPRRGSPPRPAMPCRSRQTSLPAQPRR